MMIPISLFAAADPARDPAQVGSWVLIAVAVVPGLIAIASYFATRREVDKLETRFDVSDHQREELRELITENQIRLDRADEARISAVHNRINPLEQSVARFDGQVEALMQSFEKHTRVIEATGKANTETVGAFTRTLETFIRVVEQALKRKQEP